MALIHEKLAAVVSAIGAVGKNQKCQAGASFSFRGIDDAFFAVHPLFAEHGILMLPTLLNADFCEVETRNGGIQHYARLTVKYAFVAVDSSAVECTVIGEAFDSGDKAASKAMSVAAKTAIWQVFTVPVKENPEDREPDFVAHERTAKGRQMPAPRPAAPAPRPEPPAPAKTLADDPALRSAFHACGVSVYGAAEWEVKRPVLVEAMGYRSSNEIPCSTARQAMARMQEAKKNKETKPESEAK